MLRLFEKLIGNDTSEETIAGMRDILGQVAQTSSDLCKATTAQNDPERISSDTIHLTVRKEEQLGQGVKIPFETQKSSVSSRSLIDCETDRRIRNSVDL